MGLKQKATYSIIPFFEIKKYDNATWEKSYRDKKQHQLGIEPRSLEDRHDIVEEIQILHIIPAKESFLG